MPLWASLGGMKTLATILACLALLGGCKDKNEPTKPTVALTEGR